MDELAETFSRAQQGDKVAFGELVRRYQDLAVGYAYAVLGDFHHAEDAAQDAFVDAFKHIDQVYELRSFPAWLKKVVFKHCDRITRRKTLPTAPPATARVPKRPRARASTYSSRNRFRIRWRTRRP